MEINLSVSMYPTITSEGIVLDVFFGESEQPTRLELSWKDFIEHEIEYHTLHTDGKPIVVSENSDGVSQICDVIKSLRKVCDELGERLLEKQIFMREEWVKHGKGNIRPYLVDFESYCEIIETQNN